MKIIFVTKHLYPGAGDRTYMFALEQLLQHFGGHEVAWFAVADPCNIKTRYEQYFVSNIEYGKIRHTPAGIASVLSRSLYSREAQHKIAALIEDFKPDIVHIQHLDTHITYSILPVIKRYGIPIVWHLHIYAPLCINYTFINEQNGCVCTACRNNGFWQAAARRCKKGRLLASMMGSLIMYFNHYGRFMHLVDLFLCPSEFLRDTFIAFGYPSQKLVHLPYFTQTDNVEPDPTTSRYGLFFGRLDFEKGVDILLSALTTTTIPFKIVGSGACRAALEKQKQDYGLDNVVFEGPYYGSELKRVIAGSQFVVVPSRWYEVTGLVILEANAYGKPVIASRMGGIPEVIEDGKTGILFDHTDPNALRSAMQRLYHDPALCVRMGQQARIRLQRHHSATQHYAQIIKCYTNVSNNHAIATKTT